MANMAVFLEAEEFISPYHPILSPHWLGSMSPAAPTPKDQTYEQKRCQEVGQG